MFVSTIVAFTASHPTAPRIAMPRFSLETRTWTVRVGFLVWHHAELEVALACAIGWLDPAWLLSSRGNT